MHFSRTQRKLIECYLEYDTNATVTLILVGKYEAKANRVAIKSLVLLFAGSLRYRSNSAETARPIYLVVAVSTVRITALV